MNPRSKTKKNTLISVALNELEINKGDKRIFITLTYLKRKHMIEDMEAKLAESSEINSITDHLVVTKEADVDEDIPIYH